MGYSLITFPLKQKKFKKKFIFLNENILNFYDENFAKNNIKNTIYSPRINNNLIFEDHNFCKKIYEKVVSDLSKKLNDCLKIKKSKRYWKILLGHWLFRFIKISYGKYHYLKYIEKKNISKILALDYEHNYHDVDSSFKLNQFSNDAYFNSLLLCKISELLFKNKKINIIKFKKEASIFKSFKSKKKLSKQLSGKNLAKEIFSIFKNFKNDSDFVFIETYLPYIRELQLKIKFNSFPYNVNFPNIKFSKSKKNNNLRNQIFSIKTNNYFEFILYSLFKDFFPTNFLENYKYISQNQKKILSPNFPKVIFTSNLFGKDDLTNCWIAEKVENGSKYIVGQHGGSYLEWYDKYSRVEYDTCDYFLSWGKKKRLGNKKVIPMFNFTLLDKKIKNIDRNLIIISKSMGSWDNHWDRWIYGKKVYSDCNILIRNLTKKIQNKTVYKLHHNYKKGYFRVLDNLIKNNKNIKIDYYSNFLEIIKDSRLIIFDDYSTGFLQSLNLNFKTVCFLPHKDTLFHRENKKDIKPLLKNKIIFYDIYKLINHINNNWENLDKWWQNKDLQIAKNDFCKKYSKNPTHKDFERLSKFFKKFN